MVCYINKNEIVESNEKIDEIIIEDVSVTKFLLEAANFMKSDADTLNMYKARYDGAMAELKQLGDAKERQDAYRSGQVRYPVK